MQIAIGSDHRGFGMKLKLSEVLNELGHTVMDEGTHSPESCDYPDIRRRSPEGLIGPSRIAGF